MENDNSADGLSLRWGTFDLNWLCWGFFVRFKWIWLFHVNESMQCVLLAEWKPLTMELIVRWLRLIQHGSIYNVPEFSIFDLNFQLLHHKNYIPTNCTMFLPQYQRSLKNKQNKSERNKNFDFMCAFFSCVPLFGIKLNNRKWILSCLSLNWEWKRRLDWIEMLELHCSRS